MNKPQVAALLPCLTLATTASAELNYNVGVEFYLPPPDDLPSSPLPVAASPTGFRWGE